MHVAIKQTVLDKILERIHQIKRDNREPDYIVVTPEEYRELHNDRRICYYTDYGSYAAYWPEANVASTRLETRYFELRDIHRGRGTHPHYGAYSREKFMGIPLYVVPAEYIPA